MALHFAFSISALIWVSIFSISCEPPVKTQENFFKWTKPVVPFVLDVSEANHTVKHHKTTSKPKY